MTTKQDGANGAHTKTTEELIVQYLDGELVRKELETVLFERLSHSEDARALLREYLVVRGAIRQSRADERFQLSSDLDARTRQRIEQMFERVEAEGFDIALVDESGRFADRPAIATSAATRRLKQWSLRPSYAMLALLLAIGATWFLTRTTDEHSGAKQMAQMHVASSPNPGAEMAASNVSTPPAIVAKEGTSKPQLNSIMPLAHAASKRIIATSSLAQNVQAPANPGVQAAEPNAQPAEPADVMLSDRYAKAIQAATKHEVVITGRDRL